MVVIPLDWGCWKGGGEEAFKYLNSVGRLFFDRVGKMQLLAEYKCTVTPILAPDQFSVFVRLVDLGLDSSSFQNRRLGKLE